MPAVFMIPLTALALNALLHILPWFDPKLRRSSSEEGLMPAILPIVRITCLLLFNTIFFVQIAASLGQEVAGGRIMMTGLLVFFVIVGNYLGNAPELFRASARPGRWKIPRPGGRRIGWAGA
jgi:hypothetical protein